MKFGEVLKEIRKENGDSLKRLGEKIGVAFSYIDRVEKNETPISKNIFEKLIKEYLLYKNTMIKAYLEDILPDEVKKEIGLKIEDTFLSDMKNLIGALDKESQKLAFLYIIERLELTAIKNGTYDKVKNMLDKAREKVK